MVKIKQFCERENTLSAASEGGISK